MMNINKMIKINKTKIKKNIKYLKVKITEIKIIIEP
jgi:hypothetical protein